MEGRTLGPYRIGELLGRGGMGEVYRGYDTVLHRDVAIKVLPESVVDDQARLARFEREAQTLAALNHPNIAQIHGIERFEPTGTPPRPGGQTSSMPDGGQTPPSDEVRPLRQALVLELVEGPTLADRIARGPIPIDEALPIARQIAEGLEAAHDRGILHRDLKPANIKVRDDGTVKLLDFGLAKALGPPPGEAGFSPPGAGPADNGPSSPTMTSPAVTRMGVVLGTAAYMAPEQATGRPVDRRVDVWAFGVVLFEMLTGRRPFQGEDAAETLTAALRAEVPWDALPSEVPTGVRRVIEVCLQPDPRRRLRSIGDVQLALEGAFETAETPDPVAPAPGRRSRDLVFVAAASVLLTSLAAWALWPEREAPRISRLAIAEPVEEAELSPVLAVSPDGTRVVYRVLIEGSDVLVVRALDSLEPETLYQGSAFTPFFSPDGTWVGFNDQDDDTLKKVPVTGGGALTIGPVGSPSLRGASWGASGTIVFGTSQSSGLWQIPADGGTPEPLTALDASGGEVNHEWPAWLPDDAGLLYTVRREGDTDDLRIVVRRTGDEESHVLIAGGSAPAYAPGGHLVYLFQNTLRAAPFDLDALQLTGTPRVVLEDVSRTRTGASNAAVANDGTLVYLPGSSEGILRTLVWVDRQGRVEPIDLPAREYFQPRLSPDGAGLLVSILDDQQDLWLRNLRDDRQTRLTFDPALDFVPLWSPDSRRVVFSSERDGGARNLFWRTVDGSGAVERLTASPNSQYADAFASDGRRLVFTEQTAGGHDLFLLSMDDARRVEPLLDESFSERYAALSPDDRWMAYESDETGRYEVYVRPFPDVETGRWQVSNGGGFRPSWSPDGRELFYLAGPGQLMAVPVQGGPTFAFGSSSRAVDGPYEMHLPYPGLPYAVSADGRRFLMMRPASGAPLAGRLGIVVVQHWVEELTALLSAR